MIHDPDWCWHIVQTKDPTYDGVFFVGVMSTKIYCRPSCSARPHRKNVRFYADIESAEAAGLRACKRCTPNTIPIDISVCQSVCRYIESCHESPSLHTIAHAVGYSPFHLQRTFRRIMGISPFGYAQAIRMMRVEQYLHDAITVQEAVKRAGYGSISAFYHAHKGKKHITKPTYSYNIARTQHAGLIVIGFFTEHGLQYCGVYSDEQSVQQSIDSICGETAHTFNQDLSFALDAAIRANKIDSIPSQLALDIRATAFQHRVWQAIRQIPLGQTASYTAIAQKIGEPKAVRAVANACAKNPLAIITPCHRVVPADETAGQYRWGASIKVRLLSAEQSTVYNEEENTHSEA